MKYAKKENTVRYLKANLYGPPGSGKTFTALTIATGIVTKERAAGNKESCIVMLDTEHGADYYTDRFEIYGPDSGTRSIHSAIEAAKNTPDGGVFILDSITHIWQQVIATYSDAHPGKDIPMQAWAIIKKPYKQLIDLVLNKSCHAIICGRQGDDYDTIIKDDGTEKLINVGVKMKAEGETQYEPHFVARMEQAYIDNLGVTDPKKIKKQLDPEKMVIRMIVEKDRSSKLQGATIVNPTYADIAPVIDAGGKTHGQVQSSDAAALEDADIFQDEKWDNEKALSRLNSDCRNKDGTVSITKLKNWWSKHYHGLKDQLGKTFVDGELTKVKDQMKAGAVE